MPWMKRALYLGRNAALAHKNSLQARLICNHFRGQKFLVMREVQHGAHKKEKPRPIHPSLQALGR